MNTRRFELDWLRIIVFSLLIIYHVAMYFNSWGWHIKSPTTYEWMSKPLLLLNQWRLEILFLISGMGTYFSLKRRSSLTYGRERLLRLGLPLMVGMILIVPPQVYVERIINQGMDINYWTYYTTQAFKGIYPVGNITWNHLWFLPYLLMYSLFLIPLLNFFDSRIFNDMLNRVENFIKKHPYSIYLAMVPIIFIEATLSGSFPVRLTLIDDWYALSYYFSLFLLGYITMYRSTTFFSTCHRIKNKTLIISGLSFMIQLACFNLMHLAWVDILQSLMEIVYMWSIIISIFGLSVKYLGRNHKHLKYWNEAVYPFYIFHQTVLIVTIYLCKDYIYNDLLLAIALLLSTFTSCWVLFETTRRINFLRPLLGMKGSFIKK